MAQIACSLTAADYRERVADLQALAREALREPQPIDGGARVTFTAGAGVRSRLEDVIAAEAACCPFLTFDLRVQAGRLVLDVTGPPDAAPVIDELLSTAGHR